MRTSLWCTWRRTEMHMMHLHYGGNTSSIRQASLRLFLICHWHSPLPLSLSLFLSLLCPWVNVIRSIFSFSLERFNHCPCEERSIVHALTAESELRWRNAKPVQVKSFCLIKAFLCLSSLRIKFQREPASKSDPKPISPCLMNEASEVVSLPHRLSFTRSTCTPRRSSRELSPSLYFSWSHLHWALASLSLCTMPKRERERERERGDLDAQTLHLLAMPVSLWDSSQDRESAHLAPEARLTDSWCKGGRKF